jgi:RimJ/RimL family protein N-acetyltransferase
MSEAVEVVTDYWFSDLGFSVMRVPKAVVNTASRRISEKNGMRVVAVEERVSGETLPPASTSGLRRFTNGLPTW